MVDFSFSLLLLAVIVLELCALVFFLQKIWSLVRIHHQNYYFLLVLIRIGRAIFLCVHQQKKQP